MGYHMTKIKYLPYLMFHPFDGFFEARHRGMGSMWLATALLVIYGIAQIASVQYTGFIINYAHLYGLQSLELFMSGIMPVSLFIISNWSVATLMNGTGRFRDVYMVTCYALVPLIFFSLLSVVLSNVMVWEELRVILPAINGIGVIWFCLLVFSGLCVVHEYSAGRNVAALVATFVAALILLFLTVLYLTLMDTVRGFIYVLFNEINNRRFN